MLVPINTAACPCCCAAVRVVYLEVCIELSPPASEPDTMRKNQFLSSSLGHVAVSARRLCLVPPCLFISVASVYVVLSICRWPSLITAGDGSGHLVLARSLLVPMHCLPGTSFHSCVSCSLCSLSFHVHCGATPKGIFANAPVLVGLSWH